MTDEKFVIGKNEAPKKYYLWKYLDFYKALYFFKTQTLFFSCLTNFEDAFEGANIELATELTTYIKLLEKDIQNGRIDFVERLKNPIREILIHLENYQKQFFASCFFESDDESEAMWKIYSNCNGIAIRFVSSELYEHLIKNYELLEEKDSDLFYGPMDYCRIKNLDFKILTGMDFTNRNLKFNPFLKDRSYLYEEEYRFIFQGPHSSINQASIGDVQKLNYEIFIPSNMENWQKLQIEDLLNKYGINKKVRISNTLTRDILKNRILL